MNDNNIGQNNLGVNANNIWNLLGFFGGAEHLSFMFKKVEKITSALYLVSSLIKDNEPLKWELRERAVGLLSTAIAINGIDSRDKNSEVYALFSISLEIVSILNIAQIAGLVSEMNHSVLKNEIENLVTLLRTKVFEDATRAGYILSDSFFKTDASNVSNLSKTIPTTPPTLPTVSPATLATPTPIKTSIKMPIKIKTPLKDKKDGRKTAIIDLLKKQSHLTIKDFTKSIRGCSEKTVQRELLDLVAKGVIKKEGERRWSTYSLKVA